MRISLLLQREPFGQILEQTLARYLSNRFATPVSIRWHYQSGFWGNGHAVWYCNIYLNAIFPAGSGREAFEPLQREFSHSTVWWRRPLQQAYVGVALAPVLQRYLAQAWLQVTPHLPQTDSWLIVPGNHKIRILDRQAGTVTTILKDGFGHDFFRSELAARQAAEAVGVLVPPWRAVDEDSGWFEERYVLGTPLNRLANASAADQALQSTVSALQPFYQSTLDQQSLCDYVQELAACAETLIAQNRLLTPEQRMALQALVADCAQRLEPWQAEPLALCLCHGDFQPANLLLDGTTTWLIDWEYARRCQAGYDALVYALGARHPHRLAGRLKGFVTQPALPDLLRQASAGWGDIWCTQARRARSAWIFLLEELVLHLRENANPHFFCLGQGLLLLIDEVKACLMMKELTVD